MESRLAVEFGAVTFTPDELAGIGVGAATGAIAEGQLNAAYMADRNVRIRGDSYQTRGGWRCENTMVHRRTTGA